MPPNSTRRPINRARIAVVVALLAAAVALPGLGSTAAAQAAPSYSLTVSKTLELEDGESIDVRIDGHDGFVVRKSFVYICRDGETYQTTSDLNPLTGKCPRVKISSSASESPILYAAPDGSFAFRSFQIGVGTVEWGTFANPKQFSLTCDAAHPCRLVIDVVDGSSRHTINSANLLTYDDGNAIKGCAGTDTNALATSGPDRMGAAWVQWTRSACPTLPGSLAPTTGVFTGEGEGQAAFQTSFADLTYSAVGPTFDPVGNPPSRPSVSVPVALNAAVIAVFGGRSLVAPDWPQELPKPYEDLRLTYPELATLFGQNEFVFAQNLGDQVRARNPELASELFYPSKVPMAPAGSDATTRFATRAFDQLAPDEWITAPNDSVPNTPRGVYDSLAKADPPFSIAFIDLYSSLPTLKKAAYAELPPYQYGAVFVLTDYATAMQFGLATVALPNGSGQFVAPSPDSLRAAVGDLQLQADGTYLPPVVADSPGAYPLTFVEHAVAPTAPLVDADCNARPESQALLTQWLAYLTGAGQAALPPGMVALSPELAAQASSAIAQVGTAEQTGACAPAPPPPVESEGAPGAPAAPSAPPGALPSADVPLGTPGAPSSVSASPSSGGVSASALDGGGGLAVTEAAAGPPDPGGDDGGEDEVAVAEIAYPDPTDGGGGNGVATALALVVLAVMVAVGGLLSSGRQIRTPGGRS